MIARPRLVLVAARSRNGVIGRDGGLPWRIASDLKRFKAITLGKPVIMGRATWVSLPRRPLPGRLNLVLSRDPRFEAQGGVVCESLDEAVDMAREQAMEDGVDEICVIGGAGAYQAALPLARRIYLTEVEAEVEGDAWFPDLDPGLWRETQSEFLPPEPEDEHPARLRVLDRL